MARPLRIEFPGAIYHVTSRGNAQAHIYNHKTDRQKFLIILGDVCERFNWNCYAFCLMSNHFHLVLETGDGNLSRGMRHLNGVYTQTFNRKYHRAGHIFQGRYKAILVDKDSYLLEVIRYAVLNPVRAGMTKTAGQYSWSSYRAMINKEPCPAWLARERILGMFAKHLTTAQMKFIQFVKDGKGQKAIWNNLRNQIYLGDEQFVLRMQRHIENDVDLDEVPGLQRRELIKSLDYYEMKYPAKIAMVKAYESGGYTFKEIAAHFGVHYSTVSRAVNKI